ncbi:MAG TPA: ATP-binding protein [Patescibacteria group bacterium]|nr:ATP-binding protein [Patescibacteria group bacterium]
MYPRSIYPQLKEHLSQKTVTVLTGMRRTGKTTIVKQLLKEAPSQNVLYIDLERIDQRELFSEKNYDNIIRTLEQQGLRFTERAYIALDEIQLVKELPSAVKYLYDHYDIKWILTGSSSYYIKQLFTESLAGRKKIFELFPLQFSEFLTFKEVPHQPTTLNNILSTPIQPAEYERLKSYYEEYILYGGFPEVVLAKVNSVKEDILSDIINSYINIDIRTLSDFRNERFIHQLMKALASRTGTRLDYSKLASVVGASRITVRNYVDLFEKTYLISRVSVFTHNVDREIVKAQKVYFCDNGLLRMLVDVDSGCAFENAVYHQLRSFGNVRYYALKTGKEIDFVLNTEIAVEVKETPTKSDERKLNTLAQHAKLNATRLIGRYLSPSFDQYMWGGMLR